MSPDIRIITSSLKSAIVISDLFTDIAHFQWLLNFCLRIDEIIVKEDTILLPLLILGSAKAAAIVLPVGNIRVSLTLAPDKFYIRILF